MRIAPLLVCFVAIGSIVGCSDSHGRDEDSGSPPRDAAAGVDAATARDAGSTTSECDGPSQCVLRSASCCGSCGAPTPDDMIALPMTRLVEYESMVCGGGTIGCPECASPWDPYLLATCRDRRCEAIDLHTDPRTECVTSSDCALAPIECCACGTLGMDQVVAYNPARGSIAALICDPDADCPPCVPDFGSMSATCDAGRCAVIAPGG